MQIVSSYKVRIAESNQKIARACIDTLDLYRAAVDFFIALVLKRWDSVFVKEMPEQKQIKAMEQLCIRTKNRPDTPYDFSEKFYKLPSYLRRAAIRHAYGEVSSYMTHLETWTKNRHGNAPGLPRPRRHRLLQSRSASDAREAFQSAPSSSACSVLAPGERAYKTSAMCADSAPLLRWCPSRNGAWPSNCPCNRKTAS